MIQATGLGSYSGLAGLWRIDVVLSAWRHHSQRDYRGPTPNGYTRAKLAGSDRDRTGCSLFHAAAQDFKLRPGLVARLRQILQGPRPQVDEKDRRMYELIRESLRRLRAAEGREPEEDPSGVDDGYRPRTMAVQRDRRLT
jgi:hypothetical protein